jgi:hypothetical protein
MGYTSPSGFQYTGLLVKHYLLVKPRLFWAFSFIDFELETAFLLRLTLECDRGDYIFGMVLY